MKKIMLLAVVCVISAQAIAQKTSKNVPPPPPPPPDLIAPPPPPPPPPPPQEPEQAKFTPPVMVNDLGYHLSVHYNNGNNMVYAKKEGVTEKISLEKWNANRLFYENKYGKLPPPPPPPAPPKAPKTEE